MKHPVLPLAQARGMILNLIGRGSLLAVVALAALTAGAQDTDKQDTKAQKKAHQAEVKARQAQIRKEEKKRHIKNGLTADTAGNWRDVLVFEADLLATGSVVNAALVTHAVHVSHEALDVSHEALDRAKAAEAAAALGQVRVTP